ncbi:hypothetical protein LTR62_008290 [Meristemomyces frigidus]|uniref:Fe2OG dioxygenase domain-containing protein n=1 Tax=Meristemomyces frigidus TaxID=1508187 RepID=A0AAN7TA41_9PEZI|nr:hypothetical protein LTR62_008290 [Meristemomyces frigidus]
MATNKQSYVDRPIPEISLANFDNRIDSIAAEIADAAEKVGFFSVVDHGIGAEAVDQMFADSKNFFALPSEVKKTVPWNPQSVGYEFKSQVRPSTGAADQKESYQLQFGENMTDLWIGDDRVPGFQSRSLAFMHKVQSVSEKLMVCLARALKFEDDFFVNWHDTAKPNSQSTLRLLHYFAMPEMNDGQVYHRAGAHADWGFLTLLFQSPGQSGLEICPGREVVTDFGHGDKWTKVNFETSTDIVCDLLMSWSDDRFKSTFHRVKAPCEPGDNFGERYSIAFFNQPRKDALIQGPLKKYPEVTGGEFTANAMQLYYAALKAATGGLEKVMPASVSSAVSAAA